MSSKVWLRVWTKRRLQRTDSGSRLDEDVEQFEFPLWFTDTAITVHCCWWLLTRLVLLLSPLLFMLLHFSSSLVDRQPRLPFFLSLQLANVLFIHYLSNYWPTLETLVCLFLSLFVNVVVHWCALVNTVVTKNGCRTTFSFWSVTIADTPHGSN